MKRQYRLLAVTAALMAVLSATFSFAEGDNVSIKRTIGNFYDITISGERNGDFAEVQLVSTARNQWRFGPPPLGSGSTLIIHAFVASGGDANAKASYRLTFQEELPGPGWSISYYFSDTYNDFAVGNRDHAKTIQIQDYYPYDSHFHEGYYFDVDFTGGSFEPQPKGTLTIHNLKIEGFEDPVWATFQWNPGSLKLELKEAGPEN